MAASSYDEVLRRLLAHEGGYANHPSDSGGPTKFGVTLAVYRQYVRKNATAADIRAMSIEQAKTISRARYWNALSCDQLPAGLDYAVFDYGVHSGVARAARVLRHVAGAGAGARIDAAAITQIAARDSKALINAVCDERLAFLRRLKTWPVFGVGWSRRMADVRQAALAMAQKAAENAGPVAAPGKGVAPKDRTAQRTSAGVVIAGGAVAAERVHAFGAPTGLVVAVLMLAAAVALAVWLFWRWRWRRQELRIHAR